jgi:hypothetical protein
MKNALILTLALAVMMLGYRLVHVENERYALFMGLCTQHSPSTCLNEVETRTSWVWHLVYGLGII